MIIYKKEEGKYFPYFISSDRSPTGIRMVGKVHNSLTLKNIETKNVIIIDYKTNEFDDVSKVTYNEEYWTNNYPKN